MYHEELDFVYSDLLRLERWYNSVSSVSGGFGSKWSHNYETTLGQEISDGKTRITITTNTGRIRYYAIVTNSSGPTYYRYPGTEGSLTSAGGIYTETLFDGTKNYFDSTGRLTKLQSSTGDYVTVMYAPEDYAGYTVITDQFGRTVKLHHVGDILNNKVDYIIDPAGDSYAYSYDTSTGVLNSVSYADGSDKSYSYESSSYLSEIRITKGSQTESLAKWHYANNKAYYSSAGVVGSQDVNWVSLSFTNNTTTAVTDSLGRTSIYRYRDINGLKKTTNINGSCGCLTAAATYDDYGNMLTRTDKNSYIATYANYDSKGNPGKITEASGTAKQRTATYTYHPITSKPTSINRKSAIPFDNHTTFTLTNSFDGSNRLTKTFRRGSFKNISGTPKFFSYSSTYSYTTKGQLKKLSDPLGRRTTFSYYSTSWGSRNHGQLRSIVRTLTNPTGFITYSTVFSDYSTTKGRPHFVRYPKASASGYTFSENSYDARGRLISVKAHADSSSPKTTRYGYDAFGNMTSVALPTGKRIGYEYDAANRLTKMRDNRGAFVNYSSDTEGNVTREITYDSTGTLRNYKYLYDENNRLWKVTNPASAVVYHEYGYDGNGNTTSDKDHNNRTTMYYYDELDRLYQTTLPDPGDGSGTIVSSLENDIGDNVKKYTDGKLNATDYVYDDLGRLVEVKDAENRYIRFEYDAMGNLTKIRDPKGNITRFEYNELDLVKKKIYADDSFEEYTYYPNGQLWTKKNARGIVKTYSYNSDETPSSITYTDSTPGVTFNEYFINGLLKKKTDAVGVWQYTYYDDGGLWTVDGPWDNDLLTYTYDGFDRVRQIDIQGGESIYYTYDVLSRLTDATMGTRNFHYTYSGANAVPDQLQRPNGSVTFYSYDNLYRLKDINNKNSSGVVLTRNEFTYDKAHMKVSETFTNAPDVHLSRLPNTYDYNELNQITTTGYGYDGDGNMTGFKTPEGYDATAEYDAENRLKAVSYTDGNSIQHSYLFTYDSDSLLAKQVIDGIETRFVRDGFLVLQERSSSNAVTRSYAWDPTAPGGIGGLVELTQGGQHYNYLYDGKGNVGAVIDGAQNVVASYRYDGFGKLLSKTGTLDQPYQFSTKHYYPGLGLNYYGYRFYNPLVGKWMTRDPLGEEGGMNLYGFVGNSLVNYYDPLGLDWKDDISNFAAGFGDTITFGGTGYLRKVVANSWGLAENGEDTADKCSGYYSGGRWSGYVWEVAFGGAMAAKTAGYEVVFWRYPNARGAGINILKEGLQGSKRIIGFDWHRFKLAGKFVNRPHIDIPGIVKHWPWR